MRFFVLLAIGWACWAVMMPSIGQACPFCTAVSQTFSEEMEAMDVVVLARLLQAPPPPSDDDADSDAPLPKAKFQVEQVLKGTPLVKESDILELLYFGEGDKQKRYLAMATDPSNLMWSTPVALSERACEYVLKLPSLPKDASRLQFFQEYLEDPDEMLTRDAYDEFAKTPYQGVIELKEHMHRDRLIRWVQDVEVPASRRRLYFTMLGVCGTPDDAELLEKMIRSDDRKVKAGLDAMIACYLVLRGPEGLPLIEELFLANDKAEYADTYAAIMAIRFHGTETTVIDKSQLVKALRHMLDRAELADLVIPDLAKWEDWEVMPQLVELFKKADDKSSWVRVPVINYLRVCPLPEAKQQIEELAKIDPDAVRRAETFFPFDTTGASQIKPAPPGKEETDGPKPQALKDESEPGSVPQPTAPEDAQSAAAVRSDGIPTARTRTSSQRHAAAETPRMAQANAGAGQSFVHRHLGELNLLHLWGVPMLAGLGVLLLLRLILGLPMFRFRS